ncbi:MAG: hypothetical protein IBX55_00375 [Methyloprofundus sp.]|nr:hypothetical protein [Methyloprofundus sp.]
MPDNRISIEDTGLSGISSNIEERLLGNISSLPEAIVMALIEAEPNCIRHFKNPSKRLQMLAVYHEPHTLRYFEAPDEDVMEKAVIADPHAIKHVKNPSESLQLKAVRVDAWSILKILRPSDKVIIDALEGEPGILSSLRSPTITHCLTSLYFGREFFETNWLPNHIADSFAKEFQLSSLDMQKLYFGTKYESGEETFEKLSHFLKKLHESRNVYDYKTDLEEELNKGLASKNPFHPEVLEEDWRYDGF